MAKLTASRSGTASQKASQINLPRHNKTPAEYEAIRRNIQTHSESITFKGVDTPLNWQRSEILLTKLHNGTDPIINGWDYLMTKEIPDIIRSQYIRLQEGRLYIDDISVQECRITPMVATATNQDYMATYFGVPYLIPEASINEYKRTGDRSKLVKHKVLGQTSEPRIIVEIPILIGSFLCHSRPKSGQTIGPDDLMRILGATCQADGYAIIGGTKFVLRMQEQLAMEQIMVYTGPELKATRGVQNKKNILQARMTYSTPNGSNVVYMFPDKHGSLEVYMYFMGRRWSSTSHQQGEYMTMPLFTIFRICELSTSDQQKVEQIKYLVPEQYRQAIATALIPSLSASAAIDRPEKHFLDETGLSVALDGARKYLADEINSNLFSYANAEMPLQERLFMLLVMASKLLMVKIGAAPEDNKNDWGNKRLVTPADHMAQLFRALWVHNAVEAQAEADKSPTKATSMVNRLLNPVRMTRAIKKCFSTGRFSAEDSTFVKDAVTMTRKVDNPFASYDEMRIISSPTKEQTTNDALRRVQPSQIRFVCPAQTPEGPKCGLTKSLATLASISIRRDDSRVRRLIRGEPPFTRNWLQPLPNRESVKVSLNGKFLGFSTPDLYPYLLGERRSGRIVFDISFSFDVFDRYLYIRSTGSRPISPVLILDENQNLVIDKPVYTQGSDGNPILLRQNSWNEDVDTLLRTGCLEYVDVAECNTNCTIAQSIDHILMAKAGQGVLKQQIEQTYQQLGSMAKQHSGNEAEITSLTVEILRMDAYGTIDYLQKKLQAQDITPTEVGNMTFIYNEMIKILPITLRVALAKMPTQLSDQDLAGAGEVPIELAPALRSLLLKVTDNVLLVLQKAISGIPPAILRELQAPLDDIPDDVLLQMTAALKTIPDPLLKQLQASFNGIPEESHPYLTVGLARVISKLPPTRQLRTPDTVDQLRTALSRILRIEVDQKDLQTLKEKKAALEKAQEFKRRYNDLRVLVGEKEQFYYTNYIDVKVGERVETQLRAKYTHCEPDPVGVLSVSSNLTSMGNSDMGARNTFQAKMNKQSMGSFCNPYDDMEKTQKMLASPNPNVVRTALYSALGMNKQPSGQLAIVAIIAARGTTQEDACLINLRSVQLGKFQSLKVMILQCSLLRKDSASNQKRDGEAFYDRFYQAIDPVTNLPFPHLDENGLPYIGAYVEAKQVLVGIQRIYYNDLDAEGKVRTRDVSLRTEVGQRGAVVEFYRYQQGTLDETVTIRLVDNRDLEEGDKLALPHAQKVTVARKETPENMPFFSSGPLKGISPDMVINMHGIASRMATGMFKEMLLTTLGVELGNEMDGTSFRPFNQDVIERSLVEFGWHRHGMMEVKDGITGKTMEAMAYAGPAFVQVLKHQVQDKVQVSTSKTKRDVSTGQLKAGRKKDGGLRFGEMERDNVLGQSAPYVVRDLFCLKADQAQVFLCWNCGALATPQIQPSLIPGKGGQIRGTCKACDNDTAFGKATVTHIYIDILNMLAMGNERVFHDLSVEVGELD